MKYPDNSCSLQQLYNQNMIFATFGSRFWAVVTKTFSKHKKISPKKILKTLSSFSQPEFSEKGKVHRNWIGHVMLLKGYVLQSLFSWKFRLREQIQHFQKLFWGEQLFVFVEYFCIRSPKMRTNYCKNCILILAFVNYRNWLNASPTLIYRVANK